jgi:hypothetical protein
MAGAQLAFFFEKKQHNHINMILAPWQIDSYSHQADAYHHLNFALTSGF